MTTERLKVQVYTSTHILEGYIHVLPKQRLLDTLNGGLRGSLRTNEEFLMVSEAEISLGRTVTRQSAHINKASILFVREIDNSQTKGEVGHRPYPFVSKLSIAVRLYMLFHNLTGQMHPAKGETEKDTSSWPHGIRIPGKFRDS